LSVLASPRRRDPARDQKRTLFLVEDKVSYIRQTARVSDATWLPINVAVEHRGVKLAVLVHEDETLDWVGGYPFEVAGPETIFDFSRARGFVLVRLGTDPEQNQFVFERALSKCSAGGWILISDLRARPTSPTPFNRSAGLSLSKRRF
jgi:hypothetical protein